MSDTPQMEKLIEQLDESKAIAMQAMQYSANIGIVMRFLESTFICHDAKELVRNLLETSKSLSIDCIAKCNLEDDIFTVTIGDEITSEEIKIIDSVRWKSRIHSEGKITVLSYDHISLFVRDMPIDDDYQYGIMKDILATLMNGIESRLKLLAKDKKILNIQEKIVTLTDESMKTLDTSLLKMNDDAFHSMTDLLVDIKDTIIMLDIGEDNEKDIIDMLNSHGDIVNEMSAEGLKVDDNFKEIKSSIEDAMSEMKQNPTQFLPKEKENVKDVELF
jgi:hypothetical protein